MKMKDSHVDSQSVDKTVPLTEPIKLAVPTAEGLTFIDIRNIAYCKASSNYTEIWMRDGSMLIVSRTLKEYEQLLSRLSFCRIHHSFLINLLYLKRYVRGDGGYVIMDDGRTFDVSKRKRDPFLQKIGNHFITATSLPLEQDT